MDTNLRDKNLFYRIFFQDDSNVPQHVPQHNSSDGGDRGGIAGGENPASGALEAVNILPAIDTSIDVSKLETPVVVSPSLTGGENVKIKITLNSKGIAVFQKLLLFFLIFFICVILAIYTMKSNDILNTIFKEDDTQDDFNHRWTKYIRFTILFVTFVITYNLAFFLLFYFYYIMTVEGGDEFRKAWKLLKHRLFEVKYEKQYINIFYYLKIFIAVTLILFVFYMLYFRWNKSFFNNIYYANVVDSNDENPKDELPQPQKYIHYYAIIMILVMLFVFMLVNYDQVFIKDHDVFAFLFITVIIILLIIMSILTIKNLLYRNNKKFILFSLCGVLVPILAFRFMTSLKAKPTTL